MWSEDSKKPCSVCGKPTTFRRRWRGKKDVCCPSDGELGLAPANDRPRRGRVAEDRRDVKRPAKRQTEQVPDLVREALGGVAGEYDEER